MKPLIYSSISELENNLISYNNSAKEIEKYFGGPSLYFHLQSIKESRTNLLSERHIEMVYATLASWGMHRMGPPNKTKAKLTYFSEFKNSILSSTELYRRLNDIDLINVDEADLETLLQNEIKEIFYNLNVSVSNAHLVANSKTIHHILPRLIPPIDRQYTFRFFYSTKREYYNSRGKFRNIELPKLKDEQYSYFCEIVKCFKKILSNNFFENVPLDEESFNTSHIKVLDNLIMAFVKTS